MCNIYARLTGIVRIVSDLTRIIQVTGFYAMKLTECFPFIRLTVIVFIVSSG